jgi:hypothetical protein
MSAETETRDVERIKCRKCGLNTADFKVSRMILCKRGGRRGCDIHEFPTCPACGTTDVLEILAPAPGSQLELGL